jgi:outer membrane protein OmpA-like peptidoglycan-associated protein
LESERERMKRNIFIICLAALTLSIGNDAFAQELAHSKIDSVNSSYDEQNPVVTPDGNKLFFTRSGHPENVGGVVDKGDIWFSDKLSDGSWSTPQHAGKKINHSSLNGVMGFSSSGNTIYLLNYLELTPGSNSGTIRSGLAKATWNGTEWEQPERLNVTFFSNKSEEMSGFVTPDETVMILSIQSYLTFGNEDLYVSFRQANGSWSQPKNIGDVVNTGSQEWSPYLASDKKTLYFSSNGHEGFGSRDIFVSKRLDDSWTNWTRPVNLGSSINTPGVELGYHIPAAGGDAIFSTTQNSEGFGDLFNTPLDEAEKVLQSIELVSAVVEPITMPESEIKGPPVVAMTMQILDIRTEKPIDKATAVFSYGVQESVTNLEDVANPEKKFVVSFIEDEEITVRIDAEGYLIYQEKFIAKATSQGDGNALDAIEGFRLTPKEIGTTIKIENVLFNRATADFSNAEAAQEELDKLVGLMNANPTMEIRLDGHTDNSGNSKLNIKLSEDRVNTVKTYLIEKGIVESRIEAVGHGGSKPLGSNSVTASRVLNRRVEFVVTKN